MIRREYYNKYLSYEHLPEKEADDLFASANKEWYKVTTITTINWTYANGDYNSKEVHKNTYKWTLEELIDFIRETKEVAEDIVAIEKWV